jgi:CheY-like chemotaxis protein
MKSISIKQAEPGQILAQKIQINDGVLLAGQGAEISENLLQVLERMNIETIVIEEHERERKKIFLVDDNLTNLTTGKAMLNDQYKVYPVPSADIMFSLLENIIPDLVLLDIDMPEMNGYEAIKRLKKESLWAEIPVKFLTSKTDEDSELEWLSLGAIYY